MKSSTVVQIITYLFVILFVYTAFSKWFLYDIYLRDLRRSPELAPFALPISIIIPATELIVAGMLLFEKTRLKAFYGALALMIMFTLYVGYVLAFSTVFPCSCGGIIKELTWTNHMYFNLIFTSLAGIGILFQRKNIKQSKTYNSIYKIDTA